MWVADREPSNSLSLYPFYPDSCGYALFRLQGDICSIAPIVNSSRGLRWKKSGKRSMNVSNHLLRSERHETWRQTHILLEFPDILQIKAPKTRFELSITEVYSSIQGAEAEVSRCSYGGGDFTLIMEVLMTRCILEAM
jgi:hypothetical protein